VGCTQEDDGGQEPTITNEGINILNFTTDSNTLRIYEETTIKALLKNVGFFEAKNITSVLYGEGLLERIQEVNYTNNLLRNFQDQHLWSLRVPLKLSQTESSSYTINARIYYLYNYSGFQQVGFVEPTYTGGDLPLSSGFQASPLRPKIDVRNPIRTLNQGSVFSTTITISNVGKGNVDYFDCSPLRDPPCTKGGYLNSLIISVPSDWIPITNMSAWTLNTSPETETAYYSLNFEKLEDDYNQPLDSSGEPCDSVYADCIEDTATIEEFNECLEGRDCSSCKERSGDPRCNLIIEAISQLRMIRGTEARLVLLFNKTIVSEPRIDSITVSGDFGYEIDTSDFKSPIRLLILGD
jgi:hypothetical protein